MCNKYRRINTAHDASRVRCIHHTPNWTYVQQPFASLFPPNLRQLLINRVLSPILSHFGPQKCHTFLEFFHPVDAIFDADPAVESNIF